MEGEKPNYSLSGEHYTETGTITHKIHSETQATEIWFPIRDNENHLTLIEKRLRQPSLC